MADVPDDLIAFPEKQAAALAGVSLRRLRYWDLTSLVQPGIQRRTGIRGGVRLYQFGDAISLLVAAELRKKGFSLQEIRRVVEHLRTRGYAEPLRELRFAVVEPEPEPSWRIRPRRRRPRELYFQHPDGTWEGGRHPDQIVMHEVLNLERIAGRVRAATRRRPAARGKTERRRGTMGYKEVFAGTRIPVDTVVGWLRSGHAPDEVLRAYPDLTLADVEVARRRQAKAA